MKKTITLIVLILILSLTSTVWAQLWINQPVTLKGWISAVMTDKEGNVTEGKISTDIGIVGNFKGKRVFLRPKDLKMVENLDNRVLRVTNLENKVFLLEDVGMIIDFRCVSEITGKKEFHVLKNENTRKIVIKPEKDVSSKPDKQSDQSSSSSVGASATAIHKPWNITFITKRNNTDATNMGNHKIKVECRGQPVLTERISIEQRTRIFIDDIPIYDEPMIDSEKVTCSLLTDGNVVIKIEDRQIWPK